MEFVTNSFIARHNTVRTPTSRSRAPFYYAESCVYMFRCICKVWPARHAHNWYMLNVSEVQNSARGYWGLCSLRNRLTSGLWVKTKTNAVPDGTACSSLSLFAICLKIFIGNFFTHEDPFWPYESGLCRGTLWLAEVAVAGYISVKCVHV
jgi:hypothetical protein